MAFAVIDYEMGKFALQGQGSVSLPSFQPTEAASLRLFP
jgi:hypothetical protein